MTEVELGTELRTSLEAMAVNVAYAQEELSKFEGGNSSAGTRVRKYMQDIKNLAQDVRLEVQSIKNSK